MPPEADAPGPPVSVVGGEEVSAGDRDRAHTVGRLLGESNAILVCGGGGGVMEAACRGLRESGGGLAVGVRPGVDGSGANDYLDVVLPTGIRQARNLAVVLSGRCVIAVGGDYGTLSEIAFALKYDKPVHGVSTWEHPRFPFDSNLTPREAVERALRS